MIRRNANQSPGLRLRPLLVAVVLCYSFPLLAAEHLLSPETYEKIASEYSGANAQEYTAAITRYHRIPGSPMMEDVARNVVVTDLQRLGIESAVEQFPSDGAISYQSEIAPMAWNIRSGELWVVGAKGDSSFKPFRLCRYLDVPMCVTNYSKGGEWEGDVIDVGSGAEDADYEGKQVVGKVALAFGQPPEVMQQAVIRRGALGIIIYPDPLDRAEHPDMVRAQSIHPRPQNVGKQTAGFQISAKQYEQLRALMRKARVRVHAKIEADLKAGQLTIVHAYIRGSESSGQEIVLSSHLDHPKWSANDNASGAGALIEVARALNELINDGRLRKPDRTIHFMWVSEYTGTLAYISKHREVKRCGEWPGDEPTENGRGTSCIIANLNLDMVGEDTVKTQSRFYITRTPESIMSFLNVLLEDLLQQTKEANLYSPVGTRNYWPAGMNSYIQGSDHDVFTGLGIPASLFGHEPDWTHHTSEDRIEKTDASEFQRVGTLASAAAWWIATARSAEWERIFPRVLYSILRMDAEKGIGSDLDSVRSNPILLKRMSWIVDELSHPGRNHDDFKDGLLLSSLGTVNKSSAGGPHRLVRLPLDGSLSEVIPDRLTGEDKKWWDQQWQSFPGAPVEYGIFGLDFELLAFEAINFMDGQRSNREIAGLLNAEYQVGVDEQWVNRLVEVLSSLKLAAKK